MAPFFMPEPPSKRLKTGKEQARIFRSADEIGNSLRSLNQDDLAKVLGQLRNQFAVWPNEGPISTQDPRLTLAQQWLDTSPAAQDLFTIWEKNGNIRQPATIVLVVSILSSLLTLLSSHYTFHAAGHPILRTLLTPPWMRKLNSYLGGSHSELLLVTLKLLNSMSSFGGGRERKSILESFGWETKSLPKLLNMRRKTTSDDTSDSLARPDIRTLYMLFCLSFVDQQSSTQLKTIFLEQHKDAFYSIFRGLAQDPFVVIQKVLEICWSGIWSDPKIKRTLKIALFSEITVAQLLKIYDRPNVEDSEPDHIPADLVHHFLLAICTRPGIGICFRDRGWYPRKADTDEATEEEETRREKGGKIYNKILSNILKSLKVNEDMRQQELALKIMAACPELVAGFWSAANLTLEPRLSSKWIANISFFGSVLSLPVPTGSFLSDNAVLYQPTPPPLSVILENILPSVNTKAHLSKGLLQSSGLVQHCTALALCKCLTKYARVSEVFRSIEAALEEDQSEGQWAKVRRDLEREVRHRVPEFQVIVAFASAAQKETTEKDKAAPHPTKVALLAECAQRLLWMYHSCLPFLVAETRFDAGKLVQNISGLEASVAEANEERDATARLNTVRQLHVLRLLNESDQFVWSGKTGGKSHLYVLLRAFSACHVPALRDTLKRLVVHLLSESIVFRQNKVEPSLWLASLPVAHPSSEGSTFLPVHNSLPDETATVLDFLDDCIQRCLKTPYRYIEDMQALYATGSQHDDMLSPLIMTILEQLRGKMASEQGSSPAVFALATFVRRLLLRLSTLQQDLSFLRQIGVKIDDILSPESLAEQSPIFSAAIRREVRILLSCLSPTHASRDENMEGDNTLEEFIREIGERAIRTLSDVITRLHPVPLTHLAESLDPSDRLLWDRLSFECLFLHSSVSDIIDDSRREILVDVVFSNSTSLTDVKGVISLIGHSLSASMHVPEFTRGLLFLVASVCSRAALILSSTDSAELKEHLFVRCTPMAKLCIATNSELVHQAISPWLKYMATPDLLGLLEIYREPSRLEMVIAALEIAMNAQSIVDLQARLPLLTDLRKIIPKSSVLESMIATIVDASVPVALSGRFADDTELSTSHLLLQTESAWQTRFHSLPASLDLDSFLYQEDSWSDSTVKIICAILYHSGCDTGAFGAWLGTRFSTVRSMEHLSHVLYAFLDSSEGPSTQAAKPWTPHMARLVDSVADDDTAAPLRARCTACLRLLIEWLPSTLPELTATLERRIKQLPESSLSKELLSVGTSLAAYSDSSKSAVATLIEHSLQWCINAFAVSDVDIAVQAVVEELAVVIKTSRTTKAHLAETLLSVIIQNRLADISAVALLCAILEIVPFKPLIINRYLQSIVQHPHFFKACGARSPLRNRIIHGLHILFHLHPANTCQVTHVQPLIRIYGGTSSTPDRMLLSIFQLFESQRKVSVASLLGQWSPTADVPSSNLLEAVLSLDATLVLRTCLHFPKWRCLMDQDIFAENSRDALLYDPVFLILIFAQAMAEKVPETAFSWIELFRTNIVGLLIRALSAKDPYLREIARSQLAAVWAHLETADMQEQPHVVYVLNINQSGRLPSYTTLILLHALRGIFYPSNFIYPLTARFLLQRPTLDMTDVPMLYGMLYSSSDDWKKERGWIIRFISDGMMSTDDWRVLKRRHTWELLSGLFQSSEQDTTLRNSILEVLANLTCNQQATASLILKSSLLHWIEMQLVISRAEAVAWIKILENVLLVVDASKMESSTGGEWRFVICRCLSLIMKDMTGPLKPEVVLPIAAPVVLRLGALPGPCPSTFAELLDSCLKGLVLLETHLDISQTSILPSVASDLPPHGGEDLQAAADRDPLLTWGTSVECFWQASMTLPGKSLVWDALTSRLLVWRSIVGEERSVVGEWARKLTVKNLRV
ncbi:ribosome 60S biogenesis N-terminal-domain-containing protein [Roridomyces roridus]|uniref:Ribosome 60S biogenesis N-terminal-domain-containing protein n=1 Tax=Roridomyces roridus TaxID=1738132 RepID=A0AAD7CB01_9AGAR|nr:ribosome 60S biogenesis N-terminal-domain-containing protein [Roridomyces roridus]